MRGCDHRLKCVSQIELVDTKYANLDIRLVFEIKRIQIHSQAGNIVITHYQQLRALFVYAPVSLPRVQRKERLLQLRSEYSSLGELSPKTCDNRRHPSV